MTRLIVALTFLTPLLLAAPADAVDEVSEIDFCRDFSLIAKEVMTARQGKRPMSETLPKAITQIELWAQKYGLELDPEDVKKMAEILVISAYDSFIWPADSLYDEKRQEKISEYENKHFGECYTGVTTD